MGKNFNIKENIGYNTRNHNCFYALNNPKTDLYGINSLSYFGPIVWNMISDEIKNSISLYQFKNRIKL